MVWNRQVRTNSVTDGASAAVARNGRRHASRITKPHCTATSGYRRGAPRRPLPHAVSVPPRPVACRSTHTVKRPRSTSAAFVRSRVPVSDYRCGCLLMPPDMGPVPICNNADALFGSDDLAMRT